MHSKYYTIERGLDLPMPDEEDSPTPVTIPWQHDGPGSPQRWTAHRTLDAYYVYVHLSNFRTALLRATGSEADLDRLRRVCFRAAYLGGELQSVCKDLLDEQRLEIAAWLDRCRVPAFDLTEAGRRLLAASS